MKPKKPAKLKTAARAGIILNCVGIILLFRMGGLLDSGPMAGLQTASAGTQYGILGRQAPELHLSTWIDGNGKQIEPVKLGACRGKVIYQLKYELKIPMAHAAGNPDTHEIPEIMKQYRSGGTPWTVIIDPEGDVVYNHFHIEPPQAVALIERLLKK
jgi:hypothetical protein